MTDSPIHISGPCSAESREQVLQTARQLKKACGAFPFIFRAGVWKPRTSPDSFQGAGGPALAWLAEAKQTVGVPVATEVATPEHVREALKAGIDYLWIGARTSANPIALQAIADAIAESNQSKDRPTQSILQGVLVKNPVSEDVLLWIGNIARIGQTGVPVAAVHRGCNHQPCWSMAHRLRLARPDVPLLIDPSHMSGATEKIPNLLHKAVELDYNGTMVEVHCCPEQALSDARQQLTPDQYRNLMEPTIAQWGAVSPASQTDATDRELAWLRTEIDELDDRLWATIAQRMDVSMRIGSWKKQHGVAALQPQRYQEILTLRQQWAKENGLSEEFAKQLFDTIHTESLRRQE